VRFDRCVVGVVLDEQEQRRIAALLVHVEPAAARLIVKRDLRVPQ